MIDRLSPVVVVAIATGCGGLIATDGDGPSDDSQGDCRSQKHHDDCSVMHCLWLRPRHKADQSYFTGACVQPDDYYGADLFDHECSSEADCSGELCVQFARYDGDAMGRAAHLCEMPIVPIPPCRRLRESQCESDPDCVWAETSAPTTAVYFGVCTQGLDECAGTKDCVSPQSCVEYEVPEVPEGTVNLCVIKD